LDLHRLLDLHERFAQVVLDQFKQLCGARGFGYVPGSPDWAAPEVWLRLASKYETKAAAIRIAPKIASCHLSAELSEQIP